MCVLVMFSCCVCIGYVQLLCVYFTDPELLPNVEDS